MRPTSFSPTSPMPETCIVITSGEPAGIGPDIVASIDAQAFDARLVVIGDRDMLTTRAEALDLPATYVEYGKKPSDSAAIAHVVGYHVSAARAARPYVQR